MMFFLTRFLPVPRQVVHFFVYVSPVPPQVGQGLCVINAPKILLCCSFIYPVPLQSGQVLMPVPPFPSQSGHLSSMLPLQNPSQILH